MAACPPTHPPSRPARKPHRLPVLQPASGWERPPSQDHAGQRHRLAGERTDHRGCKSYFWGCLKEGKGKTTLIRDKLARNAQDERSGSPFFQGPDLGSAQAGSDIQLPQEFGDNCLQFGFKRVSAHYAKEGEARYPNPVLGGGLPSSCCGQLGADVAARLCRWPQPGSIHQQEHVKANHVR